MDEMTLLRRTRVDVDTVRPRGLAEGRRLLMRAALKQSRRSRARIVLLPATLTTAVVMIGLIVGLWPGRHEAATAAEVLRDASTASSRAADR